ncbi:MAG: prepilin peptidase [Patescibacteria group bacterium]
MFLLFFFLLGLISGSFANALVWRTHGKISWVRGRSQCVVCHTQLCWYDNIPVVSWLALRGKCRFCRSRIGAHYPVVEIAVGLSFFLIAWHHSAALSLPLARDLAVVFFLAIIFLYDFLYGEILDRFTLFPAAILFFLSWYWHWHTWQSMILGVVIGGGFFLLQFLVSRGRWIGGGDIRLGVFMGVILGFPSIFIALLFAYIMGAILSTGFLLTKKKTFADSTPFGTYLTVGTLFAMVWAEKVVGWYMDML